MLHTYSWFTDCAEAVNDAIIEAIDAGAAFSWVPGMGYHPLDIISIWSY